MTTLRCPCCGYEFRPDDALAEAPTSGISNSWEMLRGDVGSPRSITEVLAGPGESGPAWWLPSLAYLAYLITERAESRAVLDEFASRRDELRYAVVEEQTDDVIGFTIQPWPLLDRSGRLRFPITSDPLQVDVYAEALAERLRIDRHRWHELDLLQEELVERKVQIGDVYALTVTNRPAKSRLKALPQAGESHTVYLGGLSAHRGAGMPVPVVDITWDAREAGKLAHYAAAAGVISDDPGPAAAAVAEETEARYMIGFRDGVDPRQVQLEPKAATT